MCSVTKPKFTYIPINLFCNTTVGASIKSWKSNLSMQIIFQNTVILREHKQLRKKLQNCVPHIEVCRYNLAHHCQSM